VSASLTALCAAISPATNRFHRVYFQRLAAHSPLLTRLSVPNQSGAKDALRSPSSPTLSDDHHLSLGNRVFLFLSFVSH
jgi:hypothetical protein